MPSRLQCQHRGGQLDSPRLLESASCSPTSPPACSWDRVGYRRVMAAGLLLVATVDVLSALEGHFPRFLVWRSLAGFGFGFLVTTAAAAVLDLAPAASRGRYMGRYLLVGDVGAVLGASAGGWVYVQAGVRAPVFLNRYASGMEQEVLRRRPLPQGSQRVPGQPEPS
ncbi:MAG: MFS transporter [Armatimonadota bacterium]